MRTLYNIYTYYIGVLLVSGPQSFVLQNWWSARLKSLGTAAVYYCIMYMYILHHSRIQKFRIFE